MAFDSKSLDDYIDVAERMTEFYDRYPEGSLRAAVPEKPWELAIVTGTKKDGTETTQTFIVYTAVAYRHPGDPAPGVGVAGGPWGAPAAGGERRRRAGAGFPGPGEPARPPPLPGAPGPPGPSRGPAGEPRRPRGPGRT